MSVYCTPARPQVRQTRKRGEWTVCESVLVEDGYRRWWLPRWFRFDYASVPRFIRPLIQTTDLGTAGPLVHDYLYRLGGRVWGCDGQTIRYTRAEADRLFLDLMASVDRVPRWRRWLAYQAVRRFGGGAWRNPPERARAA